MRTRLYTLWRGPRPGHRGGARSGRRGPRAGLARGAERPEAGAVDAAERPRAGRARALIALLGPTLALLLYVAGSVAVLLYLLGLGRGATPPDPLSAVGVLVLWPLLLVVVWLLAGAGLLARRHGRALWGLSAWCALSLWAPWYLADWGASWIGQRLPVCNQPVPACGPDVTPHGPLIPFTGGAVPALVAYFVATSALAAVLAWRAMRRPRPPVSARETGMVN